MKKKILALLMSMAMLSGVVSVSAEQTEPLNPSAPTEASYAQQYKNVYIEGDIGSMTVPAVTICLKDSTGDIKYINQLNLENNGKYSLKFKAPEGIEDCTLSVREGERDVTSSVMISEIRSALPAVTIKLANDKNDWYFAKGQEMTALLEIENKYADKDYSFDLYIAGYDNAGKLVGVEKYPKSLGTDDLKIKLEQKAQDMPENVETVKVYAWTTEIIPLSTSATAVLDKYIIGTDKDDVVVAMVGDSLTQHINSYKMALEHYYMTRFPEKNITFVNKGIGGNSVTSIVGTVDAPGGRFDNDVLNCEGVKPDVAIVMLGMNDNNYNYYMQTHHKEDGSHHGINWHYDKFIGEMPMLLDKLQTNGIKTVVLSSSLLDETEIVNADANYVCETCGIGANSYGLNRIAEFEKEECAKRGIPYIPINELTTQLNEEIRAELPEQQLVFTAEDRIHPTSYGADFVGYLVAEESVGNSLVADVTINGTTATAKNATVENVVNDGTTITYDYIPKSIPLAATGDYNTIVETFGYDLTSKLNNEIIRVAGLAAGEYEIKNGEAVIGTYTAEALAKGVNIATAENNPNQVNAQEAWALLETKDSKSDQERYHYKSNKEFNSTYISAVQQYRAQAKAASQPEMWTVTITQK